MAGAQPTPATDPYLEQLNFEQLAQLVHGSSPEVFYRQAGAFDRAADRLREVTDRFRAKSRDIGTHSSGQAIDRAVAVDERTVDIVTKGVHSVNQTEVGELGRTKVSALQPGEGGCRIPRGVDLDKFWGLTEDALKRADAVSPMPQISRADLERDGVFAGID